ncbi:hypothetical protein [Periweissella fabalis]|uniref:Uncharacterized protein n=1 Tax=Periweissella fabalis TaxID=1070421 RepID=A0A7X6N5Y0_9LACO|nr:hypothetical protein [Periweissella fabalis]MCM0598918.1 hypothetical protein [Periweissella fabalis]NKZ24580.1 hypothetical protein [Periweissella fabalis]
MEKHTFTSQPLHRTQNGVNLIEKLKQPVVQKHLILGFITILSQNIIWWTYPLIYSKHLNGQLPAGSFILVVYSFLIALAMHFIFSSKFHSFWAMLLCILSGVVTFSSLIKGSFEVFCLLLLLTSYLIILQIKWIRLKSIIGLVGLAILAAFTIPLAIFYLQNNYVTSKFIITLIPLIFSYLYFLIPLFIPHSKLRTISSLVFGIALLINIMLLPFNLWTFLAIIIVAGSWLILFNLELDINLQVPLYFGLQMLTVLVIFLQQH